MEERSVLIAFQVVKLATPQAPDKGPETEQSKEQRNRDQGAEDRHDFLSLSALSTTRMEEPDIASAAIRGVTNPASARGMAQAL